MNKKLTLIVINDRIVMAALFIVCVCVQSLSCVWLFVTPWTVASQPPLSMEFPRQEYWSRLPFPLPGDLPNPGIEPKSHASPESQADSLPLSEWGFLPGKSHGQRNLAGYSPWGCKELDATEQPHNFFFFWGSPTLPYISSKLWLWPSPSVT